MTEPSVGLIQAPSSRAVTETYHRDGFVHVGGLLTPQGLAAVRDRIAHYANERARTLPASDVVFEADGVSVRNLWRMDEHDPWFADLAASPLLSELVAPLVRGEPTVMNVETFSKPARVGSAVPAHQDNAYFCRTPPDVLTLWIAVDAVTPANGPVSFWPGSHGRGMLRHVPSGVAGNSMGLAEPPDPDAAHTLTLAAGDACLHHCQTVHASGPNRSEHNRLALLIVFRAAHAEVDPALRDRYTHAQKR